MTAQKPSRFLSNNHGQGIVEYILLIVVVIMIATALSLRLFKPANEWMKNYIGDYIECLLDQGELPSLGGAETVSDCDLNHEPFTVSDGRAPKNSGVNSTGANQNSRNRGAGGYAGSGPIGRRSNIGAGMDGAQDKAKPAVTALDGGIQSKRQTYYGSYSGGMSSQKHVESQYKGFAGIMEHEREKIKKREEKISAVGKTENLGSNTKGIRKAIPYEAKLGKTRDVDFPDADWSLGSLVRTLLILLIIIALVLFLAGQLAQMNKSLEKN